MRRLGWHGACLPLVLAACGVGVVSEPVDDPSGGAAVVGEPASSVVAAPMRVVGDDVRISNADSSSAEAIAAGRATEVVDGSRIAVVPLATGGMSGHPGNLVTVNAGQVRSEIKETTERSSAPWRGCDRRG